MKEAMDDWTSCKTDQEIENMWVNARAARKMSYLCIVLGFGSVSGQSVIRIAQEMDIIPGQIEKRLPMVSSHFPYDYKSTPIYEITWCLQYAGAGLATLVYSGVYCLFVGLVLHLRGQVANLRYRLETLKSSNANDRMVSRNKFREKIGVLVERHESLNRLVDLLLCNQTLGLH